MPLIDKRKADANHAAANPDEPKCPKCGGTRTTVAGTIGGRLLLRCDECGFNFSIDDDEPR